jgi:hypothetical protein
MAENVHKMDILGQRPGYFATGIHVGQITVKQHFDHHSWMIRRCTATFVSVYYLANIQ